MILWLIIKGELLAFFTKAEVRAHVPAYNFLFDLAEQAGESKGPKMDAAIREAYPPKLAEALLSAGLHDSVFDEPQGWDESDGFYPVDPGFFLFADEIDWEAGTLRAVDMPRWDSLPEMFFANDELFSTEFERAQFDAEFSGMSFDLLALEMLLPTAPLLSSSLTKGENVSITRSTGRPPKWDWEGALTYIVSLAQQPDGLPTGPGAQARLEEIMAEWFTREAGDAPSPSQIRQRASSIARLLETPNKPKMT